MKLKHLAHRLIFALAATILLITPSVHATVNYPSGLWESAQILYYKPQNTCSASNYSGSISVMGGTVLEMIWSGLTSFLTPEQAAGIMGNMQSESGFGVARHEDAAGDIDILTNTTAAHGIGLIQWSFGRRVDLLSYIQQRSPALIRYFTDRASYGRLAGDNFLAAAGQADTASLISLELEFLKYELDSKFPGFASTTTVAEATTYFLEQVERPRNPYIQYHQARLTQAEGHYAQFAGRSSSSTSSTSSAISTSTSAKSLCTTGTTGIPRNNGDINSTALALAWHARGHSWDEPSPAYRAAMEELGIWNGAGGNTADAYTRVGGSCDVFVATVMRYSGADPDFPLYLGHQKSYLANNPLYEAIPYNGSSSQLQPGDIRIENNGGHILLMVMLPSGQLGTASASHGQRSGDLGGYYYSSPSTIYRLRSAR